MTNSSIPVNQSKVEPLLRLGGTGDTKWPNYLERYGLTDTDVPELIALAINRELNAADGRCAEAWAPVHAWRALAQLRAIQAVEPLVTAFDDLFDDDWALEELPRVMEMMGPASLGPLIGYFQRPVVEQFSHILAVGSLAKVAASHPEVRGRVIEIFRDYLRNPDRQALMLNGCLVGDLIDLAAKEAIEEIRQAFALNCVDLACAGDIEDVEIELGLRDRRATPKPNYHLQSGLGRELRALLDGIDSMEGAYVRPSAKIGRNDPCPCDSGKKYKKCCGAN